MAHYSKQEKFGKAKYKAGFLGFLNCPWLCGVNVTDQALSELVYGEQRNTVKELPRYSITVDKKGLKVTQTIPGKEGKKKVPLNVVSMKDLMFAAHGSTKDLEGMVGCIYYGYNSASNDWPLTVHGYLFDSAKSANRFVRHLRQYIDTLEQREVLLKREKELVDGGWLMPPPSSSVPPQSGQWGSQSMPPPDHQTSVEGMRPGLRRTPFPGTDTDPVQMTGDGGVLFQNPPQPSGPTYNGPSHRLPRTMVLFDADDQPLDPFHHQSRVPAVRTTSNVSRQLPRFQPLDYSDYEPHLQGSRSPDYIHNIYASTPGGLSRELSSTLISTDSDHGAHNADWSADRNGISSSRPFVAASCIAAELKSKLGHGPILLPPKDYDTINRTRGNMVGIEERKCQHPEIVGSTSTIMDDDENTSL